MVLLGPLLGGPALGGAWRQRLYRSTLAAAAAVTTVWMLCQYAFQVWFRVQGAHYRGLTLLGPSRLRCAWIGT